MEVEEEEEEEEIEDEEAIKAHKLLELLEKDEGMAIEFSDEEDPKNNVEEQLDEDNASPETN